MNELVTTLNQLLDRRFEEYNRMFVNLLKIDTQMIISMAITTNPQDEQVKNLIGQLNNLIDVIESNGMAEKHEVLYISIWHYLRALVNNAGREKGETETQSI